MIANKICIDINECIRNPYGQESDCINLPGTYKCRNKSQRQTCLAETYYKDSECCTPSTNTCGKVSNYSKRIVNGVASSEEDFPWIAHLHIRNKSPTFACGGTFIAENFVVTAFHCVQNHQSSSQWSDLVVMAGVESFDGTTSQPVSINFQPFSARKPQEYIVIDVAIPAEAKKLVSPLFIGYEQNDIAILKVQKTNIQENNWEPVPICMPQGEVPEVGRNCYVIGYGATRSAGPTLTLMEALVPIIDDQVCKNVEQQRFNTMIEKVNEDVHVCAGYRSARFLPG